METVDPWQPAGATGAPIYAIEEARRGDDIAVPAVISVAEVPIEGVLVADPLAEMANGILTSLGIKKADAVLPWAVEIAQAGPKAVDTRLVDLS